MSGDFLVLESCRCPDGTDGSHVSLEDLVELIRSGERPDLEHMSRKEVEAYKAGLPYICAPSAEWRVRGDKVKDSGFFSVDIDHVGAAKAEQIKEALAKSDSCVFAALSATDGVWALFRGIAPAGDDAAYLKMARQACMGIVVDGVLDSNALADAIDPAAGREKQGRYLASDNMIATGKGWWEDSGVSISPVTADEALDAADASTLFKVAKLFIKPGLRGRADFVRRSHGMAAAIAMAALCCPCSVRVTARRVPLIPCLTAAVDSDIGKSTTMRHLKAVAEEVGAKYSDEKTGEGMEAFVSEVLTAENPDYKKGNGEPKTIPNSIVTPIMFISDEAGKRKIASKAAGYNEKQESVINAFCDGCMTIARAGRTRDLYGGQLFTAGAVLMFSTTAKMAEANAGDDAEDGRSRRTITFCPPALSQYEQEAVDFFPADEDADRTEILDIAHRLNGGWGIVTRDERRCLTLTKDAEKAFDFFCDPSRPQEKQRVLMVSAAAAVMDRTTIVERRHLAAAIGIICESRFSEERLADAASFEAMSEGGKWNRLCLRWVEEQKEFSDKRLRNQRWMAQCPHAALHGGKIVPADLWAMQIISPKGGVAPAKLSDTVWVKWEDGVSFPITEEVRKTCRVEQNRIGDLSFVETGKAVPGNKKTQRVTALCGGEKRRHPEQERIDRLAAEVAGAKEGSRNETLSRNACHALRLAITPDSCGKLGDTAAVTAKMVAAGIKSGLPREESEKTVDSALRYAKEQGPLHDAWRAKR